MMDMDTQLQAQLFLADQRGCSQLDYFRSYHSFTFGPYVDAHKTPFGSLQVINDDTLKAGHRVTMQVDDNTDVLIFPIIGGLAYKSSLGHGFVNAGEIQIFSLTTGMTYEISNPYETESINFLQIWLRNTAGDFTPISRQTQFDLTEKNKLRPAFSTAPNGLNPHQSARGFIGRYDGRKDGIYEVDYPADGHPANGVFAFVLNGVFEVQDRLLHERDGLALLADGALTVAFEALSNDAILLLLDIPVAQ